MNGSPTIDVAADPLGALRAGDRDRYVQVLLARSADRPALLALFLFNLELARIPDAVREPMAGLIRLQWWRDALADTRGAARHPVLAFVQTTDLAARLEPSVLEELVTARERELDATPLTRLADLEAYAAATAGALNAAAARLIGASDRVIGQAADAGTAYGLLGILRALPFVLRRPSGAFAGGTDAPGPLPEALRPLVREAGERAAARLAAAGQLRGRSAAPVLVQGLLARQDLARLRRADYDVADSTPAERPPWTVARRPLAKTLGHY